MVLEAQQKQQEISTKRNDKQKTENHFTMSYSNTILICCSLVWLLFIAGCASLKTHSEKSPSLPEARRGFKTTLTPQKGAKEPVEQAPVSIFQTIKYSAPSGELSAYISPDPGDGKNHPAIIWITGGDCNSIGDVWSPASRSNDQTAAAFRKAGIVMMFPSLRGGNDNPGVKEGFLGEVDDILAAATYLEKQNYVDPKRIFLGGHSTGGTLALLVAESSDRFRAVFSFGPVEDVSSYGADSGFLPFDISNTREVELRSPGYWLSSLQSPVWVFEGAEGNIESLRAMAKASTNSKAHFIEIQFADHFTVLAPTNDLIAKKILQDTGEVSNISFSTDEVTRNFAR
jgi:acetyl esterase/lipase